MAEELQGLLDRIQKEGVDRADAEADRILADAKTNAKTIIANAKAEAAGIIETAKEDSKLFHKRSESAIEQAARDAILSVGDAVTDILQSIVSAKVDAAMAPEALSGFIKEAIDAYSSSRKDVTSLEVLLSEKQKDAVSALFMKEFADAAKAGLTIKSNHGIISGFRVALNDTGVQHDFTGEAITQTIGELLRPQLASIVNNAMRKSAAKPPK